MKLRKSNSRSVSDFCVIRPRGAWTNWSNKETIGSQSLYRGKAWNSFEFQFLNREGKLGLCLSPRAYNYREGRLGIFLSPKAYVEEERWEFFQAPEHIPIYLIFLYYSSYFPRIPLYFPRISSYFLHNNISSDFPESHQGNPQNTSEFFYVPISRGGGGDTRTSDLLRGYVFRGGAP